MIRLVLLSGDPKLQRLLTPALGPDFNVLVESHPARLKQLVADEQVDVLILDLDDDYCSIPEQLTFFDEIRDSRVPVVVMTDDSRRSGVMELLQRGVYDCFRKPPSLPELKDRRSPRPRTRHPEERVGKDAREAALGNSVRPIARFLSPIADRV